MAQTLGELRDIAKQNNNTSKAFREAIQKNNQYLWSFKKDRAE